MPYVLIDFSKPGTRLQFIYSKTVWLTQKYRDGSYLLLSLKSSRVKWAVPREHQHCGLCVKYQPKHAAQANPDRQFSPPVDFLFQDSLLLTSIPLWRNVSARISLHELRIWSGSIHNAGCIMLAFLVERLVCTRQVNNLSEFNVYFLKCEMRSVAVISLKYCWKIFYFVECSDGWLQRSTLRRPVFG